jgi:hypothetical protein
MNGLTVRFRHLAGSSGAKGFPADSLVAQGFQPVIGCQCFSSSLDLSRPFAPYTRPHRLRSAGCDRPVEVSGRSQPRITDHHAGGEDPEQKALRPHIISRCLSALSIPMLDAMWSRLGSRDGQPALAITAKRTPSASSSCSL